MQKPISFPFVMNGWPVSGCTCVYRISANTSNPRSNSNPSRIVANAFKAIVTRVLIWIHCFKTNGPCSEGRDSSPNNPAEFRALPENISLQYVSNRKKKKCSGEEGVKLGGGALVLGAAYREPLNIGIGKPLFSGFLVRERSDAGSTCMVFPWKKYPTLST